MATYFLAILIFIASIIVISVIAFLVLKFWIPKIKGREGVLENFDEPLEMIEKPET